MIKYSSLQDIATAVDVLSHSVEEWTKKSYAQRDAGNHKDANTCEYIVIAFRMDRAEYIKAAKAHSEYRGEFDDIE